MEKWLFSKKQKWVLLLRNFHDFQTTSSFFQKIANQIKVLWQREMMNFLLNSNNKQQYTWKNLISSLDLDIALYSSNFFWNMFFLIFQAKTWVKDYFMTSLWTRDVNWTYL